MAVAVPYDVVAGLHRGPIVAAGVLRLADPVQPFSLGALPRAEPCVGREGSPPP